MSDSVIPPIELDVHAEGDSRLLCPSCGSDYVHIDDVHIGGRSREDGPWRNVTVDSTGKVDTAPPAVAAPTSPGRRHFMTLVGWCETCQAVFGVAFIQHKGRTLVEAIQQRWGPVSRRRESLPSFHDADVVPEPTARQLVLEAARRLEGEGKVPWSPADIRRALDDREVEYNASTINTHISSAMCIEAPHHHGVDWPDLHRVDRGLYRLANP